MGAASGTVVTRGLPSTAAHFSNQLFTSQQHVMREDIGHAQKLFAERSGHANGIKIQMRSQKVTRSCYLPTLHI